MVEGVDEDEFEAVADGEAIGEGREVGEREMKVPRVSWELEMKIWKMGLNRNSC